MTESVEAIIKLVGFTEEIFLQIFTKEGGGEERQGLSAQRESIQGKDLFEVKGAQLFNRGRN